MKDTREKARSARVGSGRVGWGQRCGKVGGVGGVERGGAGLAERKRRKKKPKRKQSGGKNESRSKGETRRKKGGKGKGKVEERKRFCRTPPQFFLDSTESLDIKISIELRDQFQPAILILS